MTHTVTRISAIRHGETAWNAAGRIQGHTDIGLNEVGLAQAQRLAQAMAQRHSAEQDPIDAIYASDLSRAQHTAQCIGELLGLGVHTDPGLRERGFGEIEGQRFGEIEQTQPEAAQHWRKRTPDWRPPGGGESLLDLQARIEATLARIAARHTGEHIVLVCHGGVLDMLYRLSTQADMRAPRSWELPNTAINRLLWTPQGLTLVGWGDVSHLQDQARDEACTQ